MSDTTWYTGPTSRGVDYSPTWPAWVVGAAGTQLGDSDFANDAFQSLWANAFIAAPTGTLSAPVQNTTYRDDLGTINGIGFDLIRLYDWDMARGTAPKSNVGLDHINFLNYANTKSLKVVVPVSDYFLCDNEYAWNNKSLVNNELTSAPTAIQTDFAQFMTSITDPSTGKIHSAIHSISVGNEGDIGQGISGTSASNFLARTIWWIYNLNKSIVALGSSVKISATFSNGDQGGTSGSWFNSLVNGVAAGAVTPNGCSIGATFVTAVSGLSAVDSSFEDYYYNSVNIAQVSTVSPYANTLADTLAKYDSGTSGVWPFAKFNVPLMFMEVFTPNRTDFPIASDQTKAALGQITALEGYITAQKGGTANSTTNFMGYCYFEFNDEQAVKLTGLFGYGSPSVTANTGTTSVFYGGFATSPFSVDPLVATPGASTKTLAEEITALLPS